MYVFLMSYHLPGLLLLEPYSCCKSPLPQEQLQQLLTTCDVFSPTEAEAAAMVGPGSPEQILQKFVAAGAGVVALRRGEKGAMIMRKGDDKIVQVGLGKGAYISLWSLSRNGWEETCAWRRGGVRQGENGGPAAINIRKRALCWGISPRAAEGRT